MADGSRAYPALVGIAAAIVVADLLQVVVLGKGLGAIGGAIVYALVALGAARRAPAAAIVALGMPVIPLAVLVGVLGAERRDALVDAGMVAVFGLQVAAAVVGGLAVRRGEAGAPPPTC